MIYCAAITSQGARIAKRLALSLGAIFCVPKTLSGQYRDAAITFSNIHEFFEEAFKNASAIICVMACGIVVRGIKDRLESKSKDPAVVVVDEGAKFAISLVSGHLGGANELARRVATILGAQPVITTATDVRGLPAFDDIARLLKMDISNMDCLKKVHMALLEGETVHVCDMAGILRRFFRGEVPDCLVVEDDCQEKGEDASDTHWPLKVVITIDHLIRGDLFNDFDAQDTLFLLPKIVYFVGIGCNSGTEADEIVAAIEKTFVSFGLDLRLMGAIATIDKKRGEKGLIEAARRLFCPITFFSSEELLKVSVPNPSNAPMRAVGSPSVAEASAILAARGKGALVVEKQKIGNVTVAISSVQRS